MISIIIPTYNAEKYIAETISFVLSQTYKEWELIVVDDGSTDKTSQIINAFKEKDKRIKYFFQKNSGVSIARNKGLSLAKGKYIAFLDADDVWKKDFLMETITFLEKNQEIGIVNTNVQFIDKNNNKLDVIYSGVTTKDIDDMLFFRSVNKTTGPSGTVCRTDIVKSFTGFDVNLSNVADKMFYLDASKKTQIANINKILWFYRYHDESMHKNINNILNDYEKYLTQLKIKNHIVNNKHYNRIKKIIFKICLSECLKNKNIICSFKYFIKYVF